MIHLGDITKIHGDQIEPVDCITFGSPCQDLSMAGLRAGLEGKNSGLFTEAIRVIVEMRLATNRMYPAFAIWENVPGAFSSNGGEDFRTVIETLDVQVRGYEPRAALDGGEDGLVLIRQILSEAPMYLNPCGVLLMEIGYDQGEAVASIAGKEGGPFGEVRILKDLGKNDRVLLARMK